MSIELILYLALTLFGGGLQLHFAWSWNQWPARWVPLAPWLLVLALMLLGGCARTEPLPEPPPLPPPIVCAAPVAMTAQDSVPLAPHGTDSQREVALYLLALHRWGVQGWQRLAAIRDYTERCRDSAITDAED